jgi:hypothetical protein
MRLRTDSSELDDMAAYLDTELAEQAPAHCPARNACHSFPGARPLKYVPRILSSILQGAC